MSGGNGARTLRQVAAAAHAAEATTLGSIIQDLRTTYRIHRPDLARQLGCSVASLIDTERGRIRVQALRKLLLHPSMKSLPRRCAAAGIDLGTWIGGFGSGTPAAPPSGGDPGDSEGGSGDKRGKGGGS